jgi:hypothetical protein
MKCKSWNPAHAFFSDVGAAEAMGQTRVHHSYLRVMAAFGQSGCHSMNGWSALSATGRNFLERRHHASTLQRFEALFSMILISQNLRR